MIYIDTLKKQNSVNIPDDNRSSRSMRFQFAAVPSMYLTGAAGEIQIKLLPFYNRMMPGRHRLFRCPAVAARLHSLQEIKGNIKLPVKRIRFAYVEDKVILNGKEIKLN